MKSQKMADECPSPPPKAPAAAPAAPLQRPVPAPRAPRNLLASAATSPLALPGLSPAPSHGMTLRRGPSLSCVGSAATSGRRGRGGVVPAFGGSIKELDTVIATDKLVCVNL